jgi:glucose-1-phosphate thymidylyltransferase
MELIGLIPAAGQAARLAPLPCSKEILPVTLGPLPGSAELRPKPAAVLLLERMRAAGVRRAYVIIRDGKWDIPRYLGDGRIAGVALSYLMMDAPYGPPFTLDQAYPFVHDRVCVFGFPDILFEPDTVYARLLDRLQGGDADVVLALFPAHDSRVMDMVEVDEGGAVRSLWLKPPRTTLRDGWICAVWRPRFTAHLHEQIRGLLPACGGHGATMPELTVGHVLQSALHAGLRIEGVRFGDGRYVDIGTPAGLQQAWTEGLRTPAWRAAEPGSEPIS